MITIHIRVILPSGEGRDVELPLNTDIDHLYARLVTREGLPTTTGRGEPIPYGFYHRRGGRYLAAHVSLVNAGVANGDVLDVVARPTVEPPPRAQEEAHLYRPQPHVPVRWLLRYGLTVALIIIVVVVLAARSVGQQPLEFDRNPLSVAISPEAIAQDTTFLREDMLAGLVVRADSLREATSLSVREVPNPSPGVAALHEVIGPVFEFGTVSEEAIVEPVVVQLRVPEDLLYGETETVALSVTRWEGNHWERVPTRTGPDGYLYAPVMRLGTFGLARADEVLLWWGDGLVEPGSYWALVDDGAESGRIALADARGRWLTGEKLSALAGLLKLGETYATSTEITDLTLVEDTLGMGVDELVGQAFQPAGDYATPLPDEMISLVENDFDATEWKVVQVQAPTPYEEGPHWVLVKVRCRLVRQGQVAYLEYALDGEGDLAPVDFLWLAYAGDGAWTLAKMLAEDLPSGLVALNGLPERVSLVIYGQPYEAWSVWGAGEDGRGIFSVGSVSWQAEATEETGEGTPPATLETTATTEAATPESTDERPGMPTLTAAG
jgi:hypothetical protein